MEARAVSAPVVLHTAHTVLAYVCLDGCGPLAYSACPSRKRTVACNHSFHANGWAMVVHGCA